MLDNERTILDEISLEAPWGLVTDFSIMPREHPNDANRAAEHIAGKLRSFGLKPTMHQPTLFHSLPIRAEVRCEGRAFRAKPPAFSLSAPEGVSGPLLYLPAAPHSGNPLEAPGANVKPGELRGRIVVTEGFALPNVVAVLEAAGAAAVIAVNPGERIHWGTVSTVWGTPDLDDVARLPGIASAAVNAPDGAALIDAARNGRSATVITELQSGWFPSNLVVAHIPGAIEPDQFVLLHAHYDSWQVGVGDNGTGDALLLEVARLLWRNRAKLRRSVRVAWWPGHSTARYGGSTWYVDTFAQDLNESCVIHMNCDSPGCRWATSYGLITMMPEVTAAAQEIVREVTGQHVNPRRPPRNSDYSFNNIGISCAFAASSMLPDEAYAAHGYSYRVGGCGGNIAWHTEDDTMEIADREVLRKDIELYVTAVLRFANAEVLPFDWRATARDMQQTLAKYAGAAGDRFDFGPAGGALEGLSAKLDAFYGAVEKGAVSAPAANATIRDLARMLIPLNHARNPRFTHDPALNVPPLPMLAAALELDRYPGDELHFATTSLLRGRNRVVAGLREAARLLDRALAA
jgi:hypothetical protein